MLIDWFTVGAQTANFLILVWLLKRFLYQPILQAIDAREQRIATVLADADGKQAAARQERDGFQQKNEDFERQRAGLMSQATEAARAEQQRLLELTRKAADALSTKRQESLMNEAQALGEAIRRRAQDEVFAIAKMALSDLATASLEEQVVEVFVCRLRALEGRSKADLALALGSAPVLVKSAFELPAEQRAVLQAAMNESFSAEIPLRFETAPELVCGIELTAGGQKVTWSIKGYLGSLEKGVAELLGQPAMAQTPLANDHAA